MIDTIYLKAIIIKLCGEREREREILTHTHGKWDIIELKVITKSEKEEQNSKWMQYNVYVHLWVQ